MKIKSVLMAGILAGGLAFVACEKDSFENPTPQATSVKIKKKLSNPSTNQTQGGTVYNDSLTLMSEFFYKAGVSKLLIQAEENYTIFTASNEIVYEDYTINLPNRLSNFPNLMEFQIKLSKGSIPLLGKMI